MSFALYRRDGGSGNLQLDGGGMKWVGDGEVFGLGGLAWVLERKAISRFDERLEYNTVWWTERPNSLPSAETSLNPPLCPGNSKRRTTKLTPAKLV